MSKEIRICLNEKPFCFHQESSSIVTRILNELHFYVMDLNLQRKMILENLPSCGCFQPITGNIITNMFMYDNISVYELKENKAIVVFKIIGKFYKICTNYKGDIFAIDGKNLYWFDSTGRLIKKFSTIFSGGCLRTPLTADGKFVYIYIDNKILKIELEAGNYSTLYMHDIQDIFAFQNRLFIISGLKIFYFSEIINFSKQKIICSFNNDHVYPKIIYGNSFLFFSKLIGDEVCGYITLKRLQVTI